MRPSGWWYALVPIIFLAGLGFGVAAAIDEGRAVAESFSSLGVDGRGTMELEAGDTATVMAFWEDGRSTEAMVRPPAQVTITGPGGDEVDFDQGATGKSTFSFNSRSGIELGTFDAVASGTHEVRVAFAPPTGTGDATAGGGGVGAGAPQVGAPQVGAPLAAVGRLDWRSIVGSVVRPIVLGLGGSVGLFIALLMLRGASKRRRRESPQFHGPTPITGGTNPSRGPFV